LAVTADPESPNSAEVALMSTLASGSEAISFRLATAADADAIALLHADSWRRNYRGAYPDEYLDGPVFADRQDLWRERLAQERSDTSTLVADHEGQIVGLSHTVFGDDPKWGALLDNLHVTHDLKGLGVGTRLLSETARGLVGRHAGMPLYLWVLAQNTAGQAFYDARGGVCVERRSRAPLPGDALRYAWSDPSVLLTR
jgi:GNAT superfamily N-acetyltransferase